MPKSTDACNKILNLMYSATAWANVADGAGNNVWEPGVFGWTKA